MDPVLVVSAALVVTLLVLVIVVRSYQDKVTTLRDDLRSAVAARRKAADDHARWTKEWMPILSRYPYDPRKVRFVGGPIDGIAFEEDRVVFVSFVGPGRAPPDARVRDHLVAGRVEWLEVPLDPAPAAPPAPDAPAPP